MTDQSNPPTSAQPSGSNLSDKVKEKVNNFLYIDESKGSGFGNWRTATKDGDFKSSESRFNIIATTVDSLKRIKQELQKDPTNLVGTRPEQ